MNDLDSALCGKISRAARMTISESITFNGTPDNSSFQTKGVVAITPGANVAIDATSGAVFTWTPGEAETVTISPQIAGHRVVMVITSDAGSRVVTFGTGFKTTATLNTGAAAGKIFTVSFISDGTNYNETGRTAAQ